MRHQKFQHQQKVAAALAVARGRSSYLDPTRCSCVQCGPCRREAWLSKPRYRSQSPKCHSCTVFCDCSCDESVAIAPAPREEPAPGPSPPLKGFSAPKRQARQQRRRCLARWQDPEVLARKRDHEALATASKEFYRRASGSADTPATLAACGGLVPRDQRTEGEVGDAGFTLGPGQEASRPDRVRPTKESAGQGRDEGGNNWSCEVNFESGHLLDGALKS